MRRAVLTAVLVLAACSGDDGDEDAKTAAAPAPCRAREADEVQLGDRWYLAHVPAEATEGESLPLVVDLHGYAVGAVSQSALSGLGPFGDEHGFVTVTPEGTGPIAHWDFSADSPDMRFVDDVIDDAEHRFCTDPSRVYVTGHSNGAMMASAVACELSDRVAAVAPVAGVWWIEDCDQARPVPLAAFHAVDDDVVGFDGTLSGAARLVPLGDTEPLPVPEIVRRWDARTDAEVVLHRFDGVGHGWPSEANALMWAFFEQHRLRPLSGSPP